jgi:hypothetical protein
MLYKGRASLLKINNLILFLIYDKDENHFFAKNPNGEATSKIDNTLSAIACSIFCFHAIWCS